MPSAPRAQVVAALLAVYVVWGSTYLGIRVAVTSGLPALAAMGVRFTAAGLVLALVLAARRGPAVLRVTGPQLLSSAVVGALLLLGGNGLVAVAEQHVPSGLAALLISSTPLWLVVMRAATGDRPRGRTWVGTLVGFAGVAVLAQPKGSGVPGGAVALVVLASVSWALGSMLSKHLPLPADPFVGAAFQMVLAGVLLAVTGAATGSLRGFDPAAVAPKGWLALLYLAVVGSLVAYTAYYWLLGHAPISLVSTYAYVNPVVAVLLGTAVLDEPLGAPVVVGGMVAVAGVALVITGERRPPPPEATAAPSPGRAA